MGKTDVYSWRLRPEMKTALETEARRQGESLAALLERMAQEWLHSRRQASGQDQDEQARLHRAASKTFGAISGGDARRAERARLLVRKRLARRHAR
jgi:hypothetical protein